MKTSLLLIGIVLATAHGARAINATSPDRLDFNRDIQPILSDNCYFCHGPDKAKRKADLRLDKPEEAFRDLGKGVHAIVPGKSAASEMVKRLISSDPDEKMPPPGSQREVTPAQIEILKKWIDQGAVWGVHWAFIPPTRPTLPQVSDAKWVRNPIDAFILARLDKENLKPSPEASKEKLIRRVTFDLTGLPPSPEEVDAFVADTSDNAYEKLVDRLLASSRYGERIVVDWLDASRYADTNGYQGDPTRTNWPWRDWVVNAMNANMPFDRFLIEQLAGDLLPSATTTQYIATAFNRNHTFNGEGGRIPDETRVENVMDRTETVGTVFMGLTIGCTRCHDHKYDPLTQKEYYRLFAYFNNSSETGGGGAQYVAGTGNVRPVVNAATPEQEAKLAQLHAEVTAAEAKVNATVLQVDADQAGWEAKGVAASAEAVKWTVLKPKSASAGSGASLVSNDDNATFAEGVVATTDTYELTLKTDLSGLTGLRLEAIGHEQFPHGGPGRDSSGNFVLTGIDGEIVSVNDSNLRRPLTFRPGGADADYSQPGWDVNGAIDGDPKTGWAVLGAPEKRATARFEFAERVGFSEGTVIILRLRQHYAGANSDGPPGQHLLGRFRLALTTDPIVPADVKAVLAMTAEKRSDDQKRLLRDFYRASVTRKLKPLNDALDAAG